jgi:hypothetical protein
MIDGVRSFASGLAKNGPVLKPEAVHEFTERIVNPRSAKKGSPAQPVSEQLASHAVPTQPPAEGEVSRARAIFNASEEATPFNPADFDLAMMDEETADEALPVSPSVESSPAQPIPGPTPQRKGFLGMTRLQLLIVALLAVSLLCMLAVFAYLIFFGPTPIVP